VTDYQAKSIIKLQCIKEIHNKNESLPSFMLWQMAVVMMSCEFKVSHEVVRCSPKKKRKQYTPEQMERALESIASGKNTIRDAARTYGVPVTPLHNKVIGCVTHGVKPGPVPYLNAVEEKALGTFLKECASVGYGKMRKQVLAIVEGVACDKEVLKKDKISPGWWRKFLERQDDLTLRKGYNTATVG